MKINFIYITAKDKKEARYIGKALLKDRLVACVNIIDKVNSLYWWDKKIQDEKEAILIAKTKAYLSPKVVKKVKSIHSYSCPCIVVLPVLSGNKDFLSWICSETKT